MSDWFKVTTTRGEKELINANAIMSVTYDKESDATIITFIRAGIGSTYVRGDITRDIERLLSSHNNYVSTITM